MRTASTALIVTFALSLVLAVACGEDVDPGIDSCESDAHCTVVNNIPTCDQGYTWAAPGNPDDRRCVAEEACTPTTCAAEGVTCGPLDDGCGNTLDCGTCTGATEDTDALCDDGIDNDENGFTDCDDFSCSRSDTVTVCGTGATEDTDALCDDGIDNDENGFTDCDDYSCSRNENVTVCDTGATEDTDALCGDGIDNDGDGHTDCGDYDCSRNENVTVCPKENTDALCDDGLDNDDDGHTDCDDYDCSDNTAVTVCP